MHKLLILSEFAEMYHHLIESQHLPDLEIVSFRNPMELDQLAVDCNIVLGDPDLLCTIIANFRCLEWVQATWAGIKPLLSDELPRHYLLTNVKGVFGPMMSEFVFCYLLMHEKRALSRYASQQQNQWNEISPGFLAGKTIGIMGVGSIGCHIAQTAKYFGMNTRGVTRSKRDCQSIDHYYHLNQIIEFVADLDYLVSVLPHTPQTNELIDHIVLAAMKEQAVIVNVGRGNVIQEEALIQALNKGKLAAAVLDVFQEEPLPVNHPFWNTRNLLITSHTAAPSIPEDVATVFCENYHIFRRGDPLNYRVDFEQGY
jgi:phosphoglycerate dehydrogenase-like enzyme